MSTTSKKVRITIELDNSFVGLLRANLTMKNVLPNQSDEDLSSRHSVDVLTALGIVALGEAMGLKEEAIHLSLPPIWRPSIEAIHDERRVYSDRKLIAGKELIAK